MRRPKRQTVTLRFRWRQSLHNKSDWYGEIEAPYGWREIVLIVGSIDGWSVLGKPFGTLRAAKDHVEALMSPA